MEDRIGPDHSYKFEDMECEERFMLTQNRKTTTSNVYAANILALFFFILWVEANIEASGSLMLLIFSLVPLVVIFCLFMIFRKHSFKQERLHKCFRNNFYVLLILFVGLLIFSITKV